ncbi:MAG: hypothetical protein IJR55_06725 [Clostridia bacterium]|nr:hypothetical protein [Clostridia bacterium]
MKKFLSILFVAIILILSLTLTVAAAETGVYDPAGDTPEGKRVRVILIVVVSAIAVVLTAFTIIKNFRESK